MKIATAVSDLHVKEHIKKEVCRLKSATHQNASHERLVFNLQFD